MKIVFIFASLLFVGCSTFKTLSPVREKETVFFPLWNKNLDPIYNSGNLPIALNSPLLRDGMVFVGKNQFGFQAYDAKNGRLIWEAKDGGAYHGAPLFDEGNVIYGSVLGRVYSRKMSSGQLNYEVDLGASVESDGTVHDGRLYFQLRNHKVVALDVKTGKLLWSYKRSVPFLTTLQRASRPLAVGTNIYVGFADGVLASFNREDGSLLWEQKLSTGTKFLDVDVAPIYFQGNVIASSMAGVMHVLDAKTGVTVRKINWTLSRSPLVHQERLYLTTTSGDLVVLDSFYNEISKHKLSDGALTSIGTWKNGLVVGSTKGEVFYFNLSNFQLGESFSLGSSSSAIFGNIGTDGTILALLSSRNRLYVFK